MEKIASTQDEPKFIVFLSMLFHYFRCSVLNARKRTQPLKYHRHQVWPKSQNFAINANAHLHGAVSHLFLDSTLPAIFHLALPYLLLGHPIVSYCSSSGIWGSVVNKQEPFQTSGEVYFTFHHQILGKM